MLSIAANALCEIAIAIYYVPTVTPKNTTGKLQHIYSFIQ